MLVQLIARATLVAGTLDILSAFVFAGLGQRGPGTVLLSVASGPFGKAPQHWGAGGMLAGLLVHFAIMSVMVTAYALAATRIPALLRTPVICGLGYGLLLYGIMYWLVLPLRWPGVFPQTGWWNVANALFSHLVCVGLPIALIVASGGARSILPRHA